MAEGSGTQTDRLCTASANGNMDQVLFFLRNGADVTGYNVFGRTSLQVVRLGSPAVAAALLAAGADPDARDPVLGLTVAHDAAREGFADTLRVLVEHRADVNLADARGNLPLHLAAEQGHLGAVRLLLGRTADPAQENLRGQTAYDLARGNGWTGAARLIAEYLEL